MIPWWKNIKSLNLWWHWWFLGQNICIIINTFARPSKHIWVWWLPSYPKWRTNFISRSQKQKHLYDFLKKASRSKKIWFAPILNANSNRCPSACLSILQRHFDQWYLTRRDHRNQDFCLVWWCTLGQKKQTSTIINNSFGTTILNRRENHICQNSTL